MSNLGGGAWRREWSKLPPELLQLISERVEEIGDYVRFGAVCKPWLSAASPPENLGPQIPWLLLPYDTNDSIRRFFSPSSRRIYRFDLPSSRGCIIYNSPSGWLLMADAFLSISLLNPITREHIHLPPLSTYRFYDACLVARDNLASKWHGHIDPKTQLLVIPRFTRCFQFNLEANETLIVLILGGYELLYCRVHDKIWIRLPGPSESLIQSVAYYEGRIFVIRSDGKVAACDLRPEAKPTLIPSLSSPVESGGVFYLVAVANQLLMVTLSSQGFDLHKCLKLDAITHMKWLKIRDIGDHTIFITPTGIVAAAVNNPSGWIKNYLNICDAADVPSPILYYNYVEQRMQIEESIPVPVSTLQSIMFTPRLC